MATLSSSNTTTATTKTCGWKVDDEVVFFQPTHEDPRRCAARSAIFYFDDGSFRELRFATERPLTARTTGWLRTLSYHRLPPSPRSLIGWRLYELCVGVTSWTMREGITLDCRDVACYLTHGLPPLVTRSKALAFRYTPLSDSPSSESPTTSASVPPPGSLLVFWDRALRMCHWAVQWDATWLLSKLGTDGPLCFNTLRELCAYYADACTWSIAHTPTILVHSTSRPSLS